MAYPRDLLPTRKGEEPQKYHLSVDFMEQRVLAIMLEEDPSREVTCP